MMKPHCLCHHDKRATYPKDAPMFCTLRCAAEDAVALRTDNTPLEISASWCEVCEHWGTNVIDGCDVCNLSLQCHKCGEYFTPQEGCCGEPKITKQNRAHYGWKKEYT